MKNDIDVKIRRHNQTRPFDRCFFDMYFLKNAKMETGMTSWFPSLCVLCAHISCQEIIKKKRSKAGTRLSALKFQNEFV